MNTFELEIFSDEGKMCSFYTVRWSDSGVSETEKFYEKCYRKDNLKRPLQELSKFLDEIIGNDRGALAPFFRFENTAQALPPSGFYAVGNLTFNYAGFPLRLYCLRLTENLVVLFNGDEKTSQTAKGGRTSMVFTEANVFAARILDALQNGDLQIASDRRTILNHRGNINNLII